MYILLNVQKRLMQIEIYLELYDAAPDAGGVSRYGPNNNGTKKWHRLGLRKSVQLSSWSHSLDGFYLQ